MDPSFEWVVKNGGINTEEGYPYISGTGQAKFCKWIKVNIFLNLFFFSFSFGRHPGPVVYLPYMPFINLLFSYGKYSKTPLEFCHISPNDPVFSPLSSSILSRQYFRVIPVNFIFSIWAVILSSASCFCLSFGTAHGQLEKWKKLRGISVNKYKLITVSEWPFFFFFFPNFHGVIGSPTRVTVSILFCQRSYSVKLPNINMEKCVFLNW